MFGYACDRCREKHQSCNHELPCKRCIKAGVGELCHYTPKRTRTKSPRTNGGKASLASRFQPESGSPHFMVMHSPMNHQSSDSPERTPLNSQSPVHGMSPFGSPGIMTVPMTNPMMGKIIHAPLIPSQHMPNMGQLPPPHSFPQPTYYPSVPTMPGHAYPPHMMPYAFAPPNMRRSLSIPSHSSNLARPPFTHISNTETPVTSSTPSTPTYLAPDSSHSRKRRQSSSALGEAISIGVESPFQASLQCRQPIAQHTAQGMPYPELLDGIHYAANQHYNLLPCEEGFQSMDGSALMASGILVQEYIRDALAMIHDGNTGSDLTDHVHSPPNLPGDENKNHMQLGKCSGKPLTNVGPTCSLNKRTESLQSQEFESPVVNSASSNPFESS